MEKAYVDASQYIDSWMTYFVKRTKLTGVSIAVRHKDALIFEGAYGLADIDANRKLTSEHIFRIASHSKMFTSVAVLQLQEQGLLKIDDPIIEYVDWLKQHTDKRWATVTVRQLLSHSAGVIRDGLDCDYWSLKQPFPDKARLKDIIMESDLIFDTNTQLKYSNIGFSLLGELIENVSSQTYYEYMAKNIIEPLKLNNTYPEYDSTFEAQLATPYGRPDSNDKRQPLEHISTEAMASATGFCSTAADLSKFSAALLVGSGKLLSDESKKEMQRTQWKVPESSTEEYGLGIAVDTIDGSRLVGHGGGFPGYLTRTLIDPEEGLTVVILINAIDAFVKPMASGIYAILKWHKQNYVAKPKHDLSVFNGRFDCLWGESDIVAYGNSVISVWPGGYDPFAEKTELEYVDAQTLKIVKTHGHASAGENVTYVFDAKNKPISIRYAGATMLPL